MARRSVDAPKLGKSAHEITSESEGTEISHPYVVFAIDCNTPRTVDAAAVKLTGMT